MLPNLEHDLHPCEQGRACREQKHDACFILISITFEKKRKRVLPEYDPTSPYTNPFNPSSPTAKPTKCAAIIINTFPTPPTPQMIRYAVRWVCHRFRGKKNSANTSGSKKKVMSQLQISSLRLMSCQMATKVKITRRFIIPLAFPRNPHAPRPPLPPRGMYM